MPGPLDPRMQRELARVVGVPLEAIRRVAPVDWSVHEGWYRPGIGYEVSGLSRMSLGIMTMGLAPGTSTSTVALTDDALVIAKPAIFDARYSVRERIALADVEAVTLFEDGWVVLRRRSRGERRDYLRVLGGDPWLADTPETRSDPYRADLLAREIRARIPSRPARWRPAASGAEKLVALLTPRAPAVASVLSPPGSASKEPLQGSEQIAKALSDAAQGLGMLSAPAGLALGLAAVVTYAAGAVGGAVHGSLEERSDPTARAARDRAEAVRRSALPGVGSGTAAGAWLLDALAVGLGALGAGGDVVVPLVAIDEARIGAPDLASARAALAEDGFDAVWDLRISAVEFRVLSFGVDGRTADPEVAMRVRAQLEKVPGPNALGTGGTPVRDEIVDDGQPLTLAAWNADEGRAVQDAIAAACGRIVAQWIHSELASGRRLVLMR